MFSLAHQARMLSNMQGTMASNINTSNIVVTDSARLNGDVTFGGANFSNAIRVLNGGSNDTPGVNVTGGVTLSGDILPTGNHTQNIGSSNHRFGTAWVDTLHIATNTLYLGDTPVLGTNDNTVMVKADPDQSINVKTTGTGSTMLSSVKGVVVSTTGLNSVIDMQSSGAGGEVKFGATEQITFNASTVQVNGALRASNVTFEGNVTINGSKFITNAQTVEIKDNILMLNAGETGVGVTAGSSGFCVDRGPDTIDYQLLFDETDDLFKLGAIGNLETIATRPWVMSSVGSMSNAVLYGTATLSNSLFKAATLSASNASGDVVCGANLFCSNAVMIGGACNALWRNGADGTVNVMVGGSNAAVFSASGVSTSNLGVSGVAALNSGNRQANKIASLWDVYPTHDPVTASNFYGFGVNDAMLKYNTDSIGNHAFLTNGVERMRITQGGYVGIGTSNPAYPLHVTTHNSNVSVYAAFDVTIFSDARVKSDVRRIEGALDKVGQLSGYTFVRTDEGAGDTRLCGVLAQEVAAVMPEAVHTHPATGLLSVAYGNLAASLFIEAIKELRAENVALAQRVAALEAVKA